MRPDRADIKERPQRRSQTRHLAKPEFTGLLTGLAEFPFSTGGELRDLAGSRISARLCQLYLQKARHWGWVGKCEYFSSRGRELNPLAAGNEQVLQAFPGITQKEAFPLPTPDLPGAFCNPLYFLTPRGARILAYLVEDLASGKIPAGSREGRGRFIRRVGFTPQRAWPALTRVGPRRPVRRFLAGMLAEGQKAPLWREEVALVWNNGSLELDAVFIRGAETGLVVADQESMPGNWLMFYLARLKAAFGAGEVWLNRPPVQTGGDLAERLYRLSLAAGFPEEARPSVEADIPGEGIPQHRRFERVCGPDLPAGRKSGVYRLEGWPQPVKLVVLVQTARRARLWQEAFRHFTREPQLELVVITGAGRQEKNRPDGKIKETGSSAFSGLPELVRKIQNRLRVEKSGAWDGLLRGEELPADYRNCGKTLAGLLANPTLRRILKTLHAYGLLTEAGISRVAGVELGLLHPRIGELVEAGLMASLTARQARLARRKGTGAINSAPIAAVNTLPKRREYCNPPGKNISIVLPYPGERKRARLRYYYLTAAGLVALRWLEGFAIEFDPSYRQRKRALAQTVERLERGAGMVEWVQEEPRAVTGKFPDPGFAWPTSLVEHAGGISSFFLALPSRHFITPSGTKPEDKAGRTESPVSLECWLGEPYTALPYTQPDRLAKELNNPLFAGRPDKAFWFLGLARERLLPDGYGELRHQDGRKLQFFVEYERSRRPGKRIHAKLRAYLAGIWSGWLLDCLNGKEVTLLPAPVTLLLVAPDKEREMELAGEAAISLPGIIAELWWQASYMGKGPGGVPCPATLTELAEGFVQYFIQLNRWNNGQASFPERMLLDRLINSMERFKPGTDLIKLLPRSIEVLVTNTRTISSEYNIPVINFNLFTTNETLLESRGTLSHIWLPVFTIGEQPPQDGRVNLEGIFRI